MTERGWWTGLDCALCGERVKVSDADAIFRRGLDTGEPSAEHFECRRFHDAVVDRLAALPGQLDLFGDEVPAVDLVIEVGRK
jgi:hypothetical protein